ncbi:MAG TPA: peroxiredoxin [Thermoanaerobaculia bacterium]|nr:peroxiredoxin [Thermoanaerobaculia bacterium]HUM30107.1 peroxiredoxin [Thermoanaerobaculia bacterium]HXK68804.1 peroxiredoxin [Thermoanaerobaculia bacterium]
MKIGDKAPAFTLPASTGRNVSLKELKGSWVVLYFYPKDSTSGCTLEAQEFTGLKKDFDALNAVVLGVSPDSVRSHCSFQEKYNLDVLLLSDTEHSTLQAYGAWQLKKMYGREYYGVVRSTVLIDPKGTITAIWPKVKARGHAAEVLEDLRSRTK